MKNENKNTIKNFVLFLYDAKMTHLNEANVEYADQSF